MSCVDIQLNVTQPILLTLAVDNGFCIIPDQMPGTEPLFLASEAFKFEAGDKAKLDAAAVTGLWETATGTTIKPILNNTVDAIYLSGEIYGGLFQP